MTRPRWALLVLCTACALLGGAVAAQGAGAVIAGTTGFTCIPEAASTFKYKDAHCKEESTGGNTGQFKPLASPEGSITEASITNESTAGVKVPLKLKATTGGLALIVTVGEVEASGAVTAVNKKNAGNEHYLEMSGALTFSKVTANHMCKVVSEPGGLMEMITTGRLVATTQGQGMALNIFSFAVGEEIASFKLENCNPAALNQVYSIEGAAAGVPNGATVDFTHNTITAEEELFLNETIPAGLEGTLTLKSRLNNTQAYKPLAPITVET